MVQKRILNNSKTPTKKQKMSIATKKTKILKPYMPTKVYIGRQPFPLQLFNTLTYFESRTIAAVGGLAVYQFSANSLFDPNRTGAGHQPAYFDQLMAVYDHYTVIRSRFKITPAINSTTTTPSVATVYVDDDTSAVSSLDQACEQKSCSKVSTWLPASANPPTIYYSWDAAKTFGPNPQAQDSLQGTATTSPSEESFFTFVYQDLGAATFNFTALVQIEYDVVFDELKTISQS